MDLACCRESIQRNADEREVSGFGSHWVAQGSWKILHSLNVGIHHAPHTIGDFFLIKNYWGLLCVALHNPCIIAIEPAPDICKDQVFQVFRYKTLEKKML